MKKLLAILLLVIAFTLSGCNKKIEIESIRDFDNCYLYDGGKVSCYRDGMEVKYTYEKYKEVLETSDTNE